MIVMVGFLAIELLAIIYLLYISYRTNSVVKYVDRTDEIKSFVMNLILALGHRIDEVRNEITARISPTEATKKIDQLEDELKVVTSQASPKCQFCGTVTRVKLRSDGYLCCKDCSVKHFSSVQ